MVTRLETILFEEMFCEFLTTVSNQEIIRLEDLYDSYIDGHRNLEIRLSLGLALLQNLAFVGPSKVIILQQSFYFHIFNVY